MIRFVALTLILSACAESPGVMQPQAAAPLEKPACYEASEETLSECGASISCGGMYYAAVCGAAPRDTKDCRVSKAGCGGLYVVCCETPKPELNILGQRF